MGLPNFPTSADGVLPMLVMNTATSVAAVKNMLRSMLQTSGPSGGIATANQDFSDEDDSGGLRARRVSITRYGSLCINRCINSETSCGDSGGDGGRHILPLTECCVCLCKFKADEEVGELPCKHFFHKCCLEKWLDNQHTTCPLCRLIM